MAKNPWLLDAAIGATHQTYEIKTVADFLKVPESRRRICLREFDAWMAMQTHMTDLLCAASSALEGDLKPADIRWTTDVFAWNDDGKATISVRMVTDPMLPSVGEAQGSDADPASSERKTKESTSDSPLRQQIHEVIGQLDRAHDEVCSATRRQWDGKAAFNISIPARSSHDSDFIICDAIDAAKELLSSLLAGGGERNTEE